MAATGAIAAALRSVQGARVEPIEDENERDQRFTEELRKTLTASEFAQLDADGNGIISKHELIQADERGKEAVYRTEKGNTAVSSLTCREVVKSVNCA